MSGSLRQKLSQQYRIKKCSGVMDCIKITYQYNNVRVALYFDEYDECGCNFCIILNFNDMYYYSNLNIDKLETNNIYLDDAPKEIRLQIRDNNKKLESFYNAMRENIKNENAEVSNYNERIFHNTLKKNTNTNKNPFLSHLRKAKMSDKHLEFLTKHFGIPYKTLRAIKRQGFTIVTTAELSERKKLTLILGEHSIKIGE